MNILKKIIQPNSKDEDISRHEHILNILLLSCIFLTFISCIISGIRIDKYYTNPVFLIIGITILIVFTGLLYISKKGHYKISSFIFISIIFGTNIYISLLWGTQAQVVLLFYVLIIIMSGILINTRASFIATITSSLSISIFAYLQSAKITHPNLDWVTKNAETEDVIMFLVFFLIISVISWLSNIEIEKSLKRARKSEAELKKEKDNLEIRVEERTKDIQKLQIEKMTQIYHFAEIGRLSSGLFHDLINPLTAMSLDIEKIKKTSEKNKNLKIIEVSIDRAKKANEKMQKLIDSIRKQMTQQETKEKFSINEEIKEAIEILEFKAKKLNIDIIFQEKKQMEIIGDSIKFNQLITNIISNSIDSFQEKKQSKNKIEIATKEIKNEIKITIADNGCGMSEETKNKIFNPFFTTKKIKKGTGIGLFLVKEIITKNLKGEIDVQSKLDKGTTIIITFPKNIN